MQGIGRPSARTVPMVGRDTAQRLLIHSPLLPTVLKKRKKIFLSIPLPHLHHIALQPPLHHFRPECGCQSASLLPRALSGVARSHLSRVFLAPSRRERFSPHLVARTGAGGARSAGRARRPPDRAKTSAAAPAALASAPARPSQARCWWRMCSCAAAHCRLRPRRVESTGLDLLLPYVAYACFNCLRCILMLPK
jgi:hypothetical protein